MSNDEKDREAFEKTQFFKDQPCREVTDYYGRIKYQDQRCDDAWIGFFAARQESQKEIEDVIKSYQEAMRENAQELHNVIQKKILDLEKANQRIEELKNGIKLAEEMRHEWFLKHDKAVAENETLENWNLEKTKLIEKANEQIEVLRDELEEEKLVVGLYAGRKNIGYHMITNELARHRIKNRRVI